MSSRANGIDDIETPDRAFQFVEAALNWQQQALKAGLVSTEMMRIGLHHMRRNMEYFGMLSDGLNTLGKANAEFLQRVTNESATDWTKTAEMTSAWTKETVSTARAAARH